MNRREALKSIAAASTSLPILTHNLLLDSTRNVESELRFLLSNYKFTRIDNKYPRSNIVPCPENWIGPHNECSHCGKSFKSMEEKWSKLSEEDQEKLMGDLHYIPECEICGDNACCLFCNGLGVYEHRITWCNCEQALVHQNGEHLVLLEIFPKSFGNERWFSITLYPNTNLDNLKVDSKTLSVDFKTHPIVAGVGISGISRNPPSLPGFMYSNLDENRHFLPNNIMEYCCSWIK